MLIFLGIVIIAAIVLGIVVVAVASTGKSSGAKGIAPVRSRRKGGSASCTDERLWELAETATSPTGNYTLAWRQPIEGSSPGGVALSAHGQVLWQREGGCPQEGAVDDSGTSVVIDSRWESKAGHFVMYDVEGNQIQKKTFRTGVGSCGIASDRFTAWCEVRRDESKPLSKEQLALFSLQDGSKLGRIPDPRDTYYALEGALTDVIFSGNEICVTAVNGVTARLDEAGTALNAEELGAAHEAAQYESQDGYTLYNLACELRHKTPFGQMDESEQRQVIELLKRANAGKISDNTHAQICRILGEQAMTMGASETAIIHFEEALEWNPKIGLKRKLASLKK
jgi:hypothetical protein